MIAIAILFFFGIYLLISIGITRLVIYWAKKNNHSVWFWGGLTAFMMYNVVFWDFIPTLIMHKHYCDTQAGFFIYKTPEQWKAENPDLTAEDLKPLGKNKEMLWDFPYKVLPSNPNKKVLMVNQRIYLDWSSETYLLNLIPLHKEISFIADNRDDQKLAQLVTFGSGYGNIMTSRDWQAMKFWLSKSGCRASTLGTEMQVTGYKSFIKQIIKLGEQK